MHSNGCTGMQRGTRRHTGGAPSHPSAEEQSLWWLLGHHLQLGPSPADTDHGWARRWGPLTLLHPRAPQPHSHLHLLGALQVPAVTLWGCPRRPGQSWHSRPSTLPPSMVLPHWVPTLGPIHHHGAVPAARGCRAEARPALHPSFPFLRLIAPVAAEPSVKHLIFYSRIESENTINISLELKNPSQPGRMSQPSSCQAGGHHWEEENQEGKSHVLWMWDRMVSQGRGDTSAAHWLGDLLGMAHPCSTLGHGQDTKQWQNNSVHAGTPEFCCPVPLPHWKGSLAQQNQH